MLESKPLRKKGGIFIKQIKFFLIIILSICAVKNMVIHVNAESAEFYEAEYIDGIYMNKKSNNSKTIYYQKARFFRQYGTNDFAYCIEPFMFFNENYTYESTTTPYNLSEEQIKKISEIAYFGYGYKNHTDEKWYAITQMMIWQEADSNGEYYFTNGLNGPRINPYESEIAEINALVNDYDTLPSFANKEFTSVLNNDVTITDTNNVISKFKSNFKNYTIDNNNITLSKLKETSYCLTFYKDEEQIYNTPLIFYQADGTQNLLKTGNIGRQEFNIYIDVIKTNLKITKVDYDTELTIAEGDAVLDGAKYELYDSNMNKLKEIEIVNNTANIDNLNLGKYYLKEIEAGTGYLLDDNIYEFTIDKTNRNIELTLKNQVIKKKIKLIKKYGNGDDYQPEKNIDFEIYSSKNELIKTISTNDFGEVEVTLPYGEYTIIQKNTTTGYEKINPLTINITDTEDETIELKDIKISVPNTHTEEKNLLNLLLIVLLYIIC
jgi:hypothetical protein